jgi:DNA mismatch repair protein MutS
MLLDLENQEKEKTKIPNLKIGFTRVFGYYIEVPKRFSENVPQNYIRKQTTRNSERYFTSELKVLEEKILNAREIVKEKEMKILENTVVEIEQEQETILNLAKLVAWTDLFFSFAKIAKERNYSRPKITTYNEIKIKEGRHPVVEVMIDSEKYVPATVEIGTKNSRMCIITGPNMGGKSTIMRMVALTTLLAQTGCFVPAKSAEIGIVDAIFTRVGASDNLSKGESTFLVEMKETAFILKNATKKSLIILDEIGRGTGTYDGISIAKAVVEYIIERIGAITLFATHYHILTEMSDKYDSLENFHMSVRKIKGRIHFLYQLIKGGSSRSFGVEVAKLAKMPEEVIKSAEKILKTLENIDRKARFEQGSALQTDIFSLALETQEKSFEKSPVLEEIEKIIKNNNPDNITPRQSLDIYYKIVEIIKKGV